MKRWLWLPAVALLAFSDCGTPPSAPPAAAPAVTARPVAAAPDAREVDELSDQVRLLSDAEDAPDDEDATGAGDRLFDGRALRNASFEAPAPSGAVYAGRGGGSSRLPPLARARPAPRGRTDLAAAAPPAPAPARSPAESVATGSGAGEVLAAFDGFQRRMFDKAATILSRADWRAAKRGGTPVAMTPTHVTIHHTVGAQTMTEAATAAEVRAIQRYHMAGHGWEDIGYHFLIDGAGRVIEGRPADTLGAHTKGANTNNIGIAMMGNFDKVKPTAEQVESLTRLVSFLALKYRQDPSRKGFLEGHRHYNNTDCPGKNMMAVLESLRARIDAETLQLAARVKAAPAGQFVPVLTDA